MPACLYGTSESQAIDRRKIFIHNIHELLAYFQADEDVYGSGSGPLLLGYSLTGHPIYSPLDVDGAIHSDLDNCNVKYKYKYKYIHNQHIIKYDKAKINH